MKTFLLAVLFQLQDDASFELYEVKVSQIDKRFHDALDSASSPLNLTLLLVFDWILY